MILRVLLTILVPLSLLLLPGCPGRKAPPLSVEQPPAAERPALKADATPKEQLDRRIADLEGELRTAKADRELANKREREAEQRAWRTWTRWIAAIAIPLAVLAIGLGCWFGQAKLALGVGGSVIGAALALQAWGESMALARFLLPVAVLVGIAAVAIVLLRRDRAAVAGAKLADAIEKGADEFTLEAAKLEAKAAQVAAGLHARIQRARGKKTDREKAQESAP